MAKVSVASLGVTAPTEKLDVQLAPEEFHNDLSRNSLCAATRTKSKCRTKSSRLSNFCFLVPLLSCLSACLLVVDVLTFGDNFTGSWLGAGLAHLQYHSSWSSCMTELMLVLAAIILVTSRFTTARPQKPRSSLEATSKCRTTRVGARSCHQTRPHSAHRQTSDDSGGASAGCTDTESVSSTLWKCKQGLELAARNGDVEKAAELLLKFEESGGEPGAVFYNWLIGACAKRGDLRAAELWLKRMERKGIQATICSYNTMLGAFAKADKPDACEQWLQRMVDTDMEVNVVSFSAAIYAHARSGNLKAAEAWFQKMLTAGIRADALCYNALIHACGVRGALADAMRWLEEMESQGMKTCVTTYTTVIGACAKRGDIDSAESWFARMVEKGVQPNVVTFSSMINACAKAGSLARAEDWHERMVEHGITADAHSFTAVINACARQAGPDCAEAAERWLTRSEEAGVAEDVVYSAAIDACGKSGDADRALRVFNRMKARGFKVNIIAYAALARSLALRGDWIKVESLAQCLVADGLKMNDYFVYAQLLAYAVSQPRQAERAEACFRSAIKDGVRANDHIVGVLVRAIGRPRCMELMGELCGGRPIPSRPHVSSRGGARSSGRVGAAATGGALGHKD